MNILIKQSGNLTQTRYRNRGKEKTATKKILKRKEKNRHSIRDKGRVLDRQVGSQLVSRRIQRQRSSQQRQTDIDREKIVKI